MGSDGPGVVMQKTSRDAFGTRRRAGTEPARGRSGDGWFLLIVFASLCLCLELGDPGPSGAAFGPEGLLLTVRETAGVARRGEVARGGVPMPRDLNLSDPSGFVLVDGGGNPVPAEFRVLARWNAGRDAADAPIQWLLIAFPASVQAGGTAAYRLVVDGSAGPPPEPGASIRIDRTGDRVTVDTGAATFCLDGSAGALFHEVSAAGGTRQIRGGSLEAWVDGARAAFPRTSRITVEQAGVLSAVVRTEGVYDLPPRGGGSLRSVRRYVFSAGSPVAVVRHVVRWEGDLCRGDGWDLACDADADGGSDVNARLVSRVREGLLLDLDVPLDLTVLGEFDAPPVEAALHPGDQGWVQQRLRPDPAAAPAFVLSVPGAPIVEGDRADGGVLALAGPGGAVAVALDHMHRYEPQALRGWGAGELAVDLVDGTAWLGQRQGLFATLAVGAFASSPARPELDRLVWAPLNHPLHAWPAADWFSASQAVEAFPAGVLPEGLARYDDLVSTVVARTLLEVEERGLFGLMTFGLYPRLWAHPLYGDELADCGEGDPTPGLAWDDLYWCTTWTDYHNTVLAASVHAMRSGRVEVLDEIAFPGALRMLYTQIMQCAPEDPYFYCGQAPAGYGGYRSDFNSSHAYFDNLMLYYWLTGDSTVVETLERGAASMRSYLCSRRPGEPCRPDDPPSDAWADLTGRVASQWLSVFRFVGLAGEDASFLDDYRSGLARAVTQYYVEALQDGRAYGFWTDRPLAGPGSYTTGQLWMVSLYDMNNLVRLQQDTRDAPIGDPGLAPSRVLAAWARTLVRFGSQVAGDGSAAGAWPNQLDFAWQGHRIGGTLLGVWANTQGGDPFLYDTGKATVTALLVRAGRQTGDPGMAAMGEDLTQLALDAAAADGSPLGKTQGLYQARLHAAVALLGSTEACVDRDGDGYGAPASPACAHPEPDCDDADPGVNPGSPEIPQTGVDEDCDGETDEVCVVSAVARGSGMDGKLHVLRSLRDRHLRAGADGRALVRAYYAWSPVGVRALAGRPLLRALVRIALWPVIGLASLA